MSLFPLTGHSCSTSELELLSLPYCLSGLGIVNPNIIADSQHCSVPKSLILLKI